MSKKWAGIAIIALLALVFVPKSQHPNDRTRPESLSAEREIEMKQQLVSTDVQLTDELCRNQCALAFHKTLKRLSTEPTASNKIVTLQATQKEHPHMDYLIWSTHNLTLQQGKSVGTLNAEVAQSVRGELQKAKMIAETGVEYRSSPIIVGKDTYFVLGVPAEDNKSSLVGVIHQEILGQVASHQIKNLRIVPFPSNKSWKIESVDAKTLQNVKVNHPVDNKGTSHYHKNEVVVKFKQAPTEAQLNQMQKEIKALKMNKLKLGSTYVFQAETMEAKQLMDYFRKWHVVYVEPHYLYATNDNSADNAPVPNDILYSKYQWNLPIIETEVGWELGKGSKDVIVAIVDTGVDVNHPDLQGHLLTGYNVVNPDELPMDDVGHGTHVSGVISALVNNGEGVAGMTWYNPILPVKVLDASGQGNTYNVAQGIIWAADHGAKVINMSLGNYAEANFLHDAIKYAYNKDIVLIAAAGNDNTENPGYPAAYPEVFAVAAADSNKNKASFSNFGDYIAVAAPGVNIASTYPHNQYAALSGTSMASPHVTALAALIRSVNPKLKNIEVMDIMRKSAEDLGTPGKDKYYGYGQIDVVHALQQAQGISASAASWPQWISHELELIKKRFS
ncbi:MAG: serine protease [Bacilli bacterium]|nr:serine protease [Bacilli bacterium]